MNENFIATHLEAPLPEVVQGKIFSNDKYLKEL
jgi:hypothetical protein